MTNNISFAYFKVEIPEEVFLNERAEKPHNNVGYVCVSLERPPKDSGSEEYNAGVSFCSPFDVEDKLGRLNKKKARMIANGRRQCNRIGRRIKLNLPRQEGFNLQDVHKKILSTVLDSELTVLKRGRYASYAPRWAKEAIKLGAEFKLYSNKDLDAHRNTNTRN